MIEAREIAEAIAPRAPEGDAECWVALARVTDDDPTFVYNDDESSGMSVQVQILTGPFAGSTLPAMMSSPLGSGVTMRPIKPGLRVAVMFVDGTVNGLALVLCTVPGGKETPLPTAVAGVKVDEEGLAKNEIHAPGKGVGLRFYIQGAAFVVKLKGTQKEFAGELYIEADDAKNSSDGNGTFIRIVRDQASDSFAVKLRTAEGASITAFKKTVTISSPNGENNLWVDDTGGHFNGKLFDIQADTVQAFGTILLNYSPLLPPPVAGIGGVAFAKPGGSILGVADLSKSVYIGA